MNSRLSDQLDKVLALADSNHEAEAVVAVRKAREMLERHGLSFGDLARAAVARRPANRPSGVMSFFSLTRDGGDEQIDELRQEISELQAQLTDQSLHLDFWRRRAADLEQTASHAQTEAGKWRALARETAEKLWDIGQTIQNDASSEPFVTEPETKISSG